MEKRQVSHVPSIPSPAGLSPTSPPGLRPCQAHPNQPIFFLSSSMDSAGHAIPGTLRNHTLSDSSSTAHKARHECSHLTVLLTAKAWHTTEPTHKNLTLGQLVLGLFLLQFLLRGFLVSMESNGFPPSTFREVVNFSHHNLTEMKGRANPTQSRAYLPVSPPSNWKAGLTGVPWPQSLLDTS